MELADTVGNSSDPDTVRIARMYCELVDDCRNRLPSHLSEDVVLDWFGRMVPGKEAVVAFFREQPGTVHKLKSIIPSDPLKLGREFSIRKQKKPCAPRDSSDCKLRIVLDRKQPFYHTGKKLPGTPAVVLADEAPSGRRVELGQGDGPNVDYRPERRFLEASGHVEFTVGKQSPASTKNLKLVADTSRWERPTRLHLTYEVPQGTDSIRAFEILQIVYSSTSICRRNLASAFSQA